MAHNHPDKTLSDKAIAWFSRLHSGDATAAEHRRFRAWCARSQAHAQAFDQISALWDDLDGLDVRAETERTKEKAVGKDLTRQQPLHRGQEHGVARRSAALIALLLILLGGTIWLPDAATRLGSDYYTEIGEQKTLTLADGSTVYLDTDTALSVDFLQHARRLVLHQGRALFVIAADKTRPFEVDLAGVEVRALGTVFEVYNKPNEVVVTVLESAVRVSSNGTAVRLTPGQQIHYRTETGLSEVESVNLAQVAAWRRGKLVFNNRPLGEVIDEVNRYRAGTIIILDQRLRTSLVSGIFDIRDPDTVLQALQDTLPIRVYRLTRYLIFLDRIEPPRT